MTAVNRRSNCSRIWLDQRDFRRGEIWHRRDAMNKYEKAYLLSETIAFAAAVLRFGIGQSCVQDWVQLERKTAPEFLQATPDRAVRFQSFRLFRHAVLKAAPAPAREPSRFPQHRDSQSERRA
jgi:hypothetical protein